MLRAFALLALAARAAAQTPSFAAGSPTLKYETSTDGAPGDVVDDELWHNTASANMVIRLSIPITSSASPSGSDLDTPAASFISVASADSPSTLLASVTTSTYIYTASAGTLDYTFTFRAAAYGTYTIKFDCTTLRNNAVPADRLYSAACATEEFTVKVGFSPVFKIVNGAVDVTSQWLDPRDTTTNYLQVTSGSTTIGLDTTQFPDVTAAADFTFSGVDALTSLGGAPAASPNTPARMSFLLNLDGTAPGVQTGFFLGGAFKRTDGVGSRNISLAIRNGWTPNLAFADISEGIATGAYDTSAIIVPSTDTGLIITLTNDGGANWFNADSSSANPSDIHLLVSGVNSGEVVDPDTFPTTLDALLGGVTPATRPGASARSGGITGTVNYNSSFGAYTVVAPFVLDAVLSTTGLPPGTYTFTIPSGTLKLENADTYNAPVSATLKIGFVPRVKVLDTSSSTPVDVTGTWLDQNSGSLQLNLLPNVGFTFAANNVNTDGAATTKVELFDSTFVANVAANGTFSVSAVPFNLEEFSSASASVPFTIQPNQLKRSDGVYNCFTSGALKYGFVPTLSFSDSDGHNDIAFRPWSQSASVSLNISYPSLIGGPNQTVSGTTTYPFPAFSTAGLFKGIPAASTFGLANPASLSDGPGTLQGSGASTSAAYPVDISSLAPGPYTYAIAAGSVCTATLCNGPVSSKLDVGYDLEAELFTGSGDAQKEVDWTTWVDAASVTVRVSPGVPYTWSTPDAAAFEFDNDVTEAFKNTAGTTCFGTGVSVDTSSTGQTDAVTVSATGEATCSSQTLGNNTLFFAGGQIQRSDGAWNADLTLTLKLGWVPEVDIPETYFGAGADFEVAITVPVYSPTITLDTTPTTFAHLFDTTAFPGPAGTEGTKASEGVYSITLPTGVVPHGHYPVTIKSGALFSTTGIPNAEVTGWINVGFGVTLHLEDAEGNEIDGQYLETGAADIMDPTVYLSLTFDDASVASALQAKDAATSITLADATDFYDGDSPAAPTTTGVASAATGIASPASVKGEFLPGNKLRFKLTSPEKNSVATDAASIATSDALCVAGVGCLASGTFDIARTTDSLTGNVYSFADVVTPSLSGNYFGALDGDGAEVPASAPVPVLNNSVFIVFKKGSVNFNLAPIVTCTGGLVPGASSISTVYAKFTVALSTVALGTYDCTAVPAGTDKVSPRTVRLIVGLEARGYALNGTPLPRQDRAIYVSASDFNLGVLGAAGAAIDAQPSVKFSDLITALTAEDGSDALDGISVRDQSFTASAPSDKAAQPQGDSPTVPAPANYKYYTLNVGGLMDGVYTATLADNSSVVTDMHGASALLSKRNTFGIVIDRTAPKATATTAANPLTAGAPGAVAIPVGMFVDAISTFADLTFDIVEGPPGWSVEGAVLSVLPHVAPTSVPLRFTLSATDEAGNKATAVLTVPVLDAVTATLSAADARGSSTTVLTTKPDATTGALSLSLTVDFGTAAGPLPATSLSCTLSQYNDGPAGNSSGGASPCVFTSVTVSPASGNARRFTYAVVVSAATVDEVENSHGSLVFALNTSHVASPAGASAAEANTVSVVVDSEAPMFDQTYSPRFAASRGVFFTDTLEGLFHDDVSAAGAISLVTASPSSQFGITFTAGLQGVATISGRPTSVPPSGFVTFAVTAKDAAGNTATNPVAIKLFITAAPAPVPTLVPHTSQLAFKEGDDPLLVDAAASFTYSTMASAGKIYSVVATLSSPDTDNLKSGSEALSTSSVGAVEFFDSTRGVQTVTLTAASETATLTDAQVTATLNMLTYTNTASDATSGVRTVLIQVLQWNAALGPSVAEAVNDDDIDSQGLPVVVATYTRTIKVTAVNDKPVVAVAAANTAQIIDMDGSNSINLFTSVPTLSDVDDEQLSSVVVSIATTDSTIDFDATIGGTTGASIKSAAGTTTYACEKGSDLLYFDENIFNGLVGPKNFGSIQAVWSSTTCALTITPEGAKAANIDLFTKALNAVSFIAKDSANPANYRDPLVSSTFSGGYVQRKVSITATDAGSTGSPTTSLVATTVLIIQLDDSPPEFHARAAFSPGGVFYSTDASAPSYLTADAEGVISGRMLFVNASAPSTFVYLDLTPVTLTGSDVAGGAISDADSNTNSNVNGAYFVGANPGGFTLGCTPATATAPETAYPTAAASFISADPAAAHAVCAGMIATASFTYLATGPSKFTVTPGSTVPATYGGVIFFRLSYTSKTGADASTGAGGTSEVLTIDFPVAFRTPACALSTANNYEAAFGTNVALAYLPQNSLCEFDPITIDASSSVPVVAELGDFASADANLAAAAAALLAQGQPASVIAAALSSARNAARGTASVTINPSSLVGAGSAAITSGFLDDAGKEDLAAVPGAPADLSLVLLLGPSGTTFSKPVTVCIFVGDTPDGQYQVLNTATELPSGGFGPITSLENQDFNAATGKLCGDTYHFSAFFPVPLPIPVFPSVPKAQVMGGACPNSCGGHGYCRTEGKCVCFAGYTGYDCTIRTCPSGASWGEVDLGVADAGVHVDSECSGRGLCDRTSALCACFAGYEGAACERQACPNDCSGHGKCRFLAELPEVAAAGYSKWEAKRVQKCVCDGGFMGADCSQRVCPFGDDPETITSSVSRQVQKLTLSYVNVPAAASPSDYDNDELALAFTLADGSRFVTPTITSFTSSTGSIAAALNSLPQDAVTGAVVSADSGNSDSSLSYYVTFAGPTNTGNEELLQCAFNSDGVTLGCSAPGCQPKFKQPRLFVYDKLTTTFSVSELAVLEQPEAVAGGNLATNPNVWGAETTLLISAGNGVPNNFTYQWIGTKAYGSDALPDGVVTPLPSADARTTVVGPFGLLLDFSTSDSNIATGSYDFKWSLPKCKVTEETPASADMEHAECANRGVCDRTSGQCTCFDGYSGSVCNAQVRAARVRVRAARHNHPFPSFHISPPTHTLSLPLSPLAQVIVV